MRIHIQSTIADLRKARLALHDMEEQGRRDGENPVAAMTGEYTADSTVRVPARPCWTCLFIVILLCRCFISITRLCLIYSSHTPYLRHIYLIFHMYLQMPTALDRAEGRCGQKGEFTEYPDPGCLPRGLAIRTV